MLTKQKEIVEFFEKHLDKLNWDNLYLNTNIPSTFFEKNLDKVDWYSLCLNTNIPSTFFEKHLDKINWYWLCQNTNIPSTFFEKHLDKVDWNCLCRNNFSFYFDNQEIQQTKSKMKQVLNEIESIVFAVPPNVFSCLPKGGAGYLER